MAKKSKKRKKEICQNIGFVLSIFLTAMSFVLFGMLIKMSIIPTKYMTILCAIYFPIIIFLIFIMMYEKIKLKLKIPCEVMTFIIIVLLAFGNFYLYKTMNFMGSIGDKEYQIENYYIVVLKNSSYKQIEGLSGKNIGIHVNALDSYSDALSILDEKITYKEKKYDDFIQMGKDLVDKKIDAMYINGSYLSILQDENENFQNEIKILDTIEIQVKNETVKKDINVTKEAFNVYISGIDIYGDISSVSRSDVNMIVTVNPNTHKVLLTSIPRDYYVRLHGTTGYLDKLTHAGIYGVDMSISTIEDLLDIDINYYVRVNFTTLISLVDAVGGVDVYSDANLTAYTNPNCKYVLGNNHLDGTCALAFARERYAYSSGDRHRVQNQQAILTAIMNKALSSKTLITKYTNILDSLHNSFQTNISSEKIYGLVNMQLDKMPNWEIESISLDGTGSSEFTYSYSGQRLYVMVPDMDTVNNAKQKIGEVLATN